MDKHIISVQVLNRPGAMARIAGLFSGRGFNINSLAVGETENPDVSRMTIVVAGDSRVLEQVHKQLSKLVDVLKVHDVTEGPYVERDLALVRVHAPVARRGEILELVEVFRARVVDVGQNDLTIELSGSEEKVEAMLELLRPYGISEMARAGRIALPRA